MYPQLIQQTDRLVNSQTPKYLISCRATWAMHALNTDCNSSMTCRSICIYTWWCIILYISVHMCTPAWVHTCNFCVYVYLSFCHSNFQAYPETSKSLESIPSSARRRRRSNSRIRRRVSCAYCLRRFTQFREQPNFVCHYSHTMLRVCTPSPNKDCPCQNAVFSASLPISLCLTEDLEQT